MFLGEYKTKFTGRGRVILPKKIRIGLEGDSAIILSKGFEKCILGYRREEFQKLAEKQFESSVTEEKARNLRRYIFSGSEEVKLDQQARFVISNALLMYGQLKDLVYIIGAGDHFEIWDSENWEAHVKELEEDNGKLS